MSERTASHESRIARLVQAVFLYISDCIRERDHESVRGLRLSIEQIDKIGRLTATDLVRLGNVGNLVHLRLDQRALDQALKSIDEERQREELVEHCMRRDAPRAMMKAFFGLSRNEYAKLRSLYGLPASPGRIAHASEPIERRIYREWLANSAAWSPQSLVVIADTLDVSLRLVWNEVDRMRRHDAEREGSKRPT